jgi:hypothetical protein
VRNAKITNIAAISIHTMRLMGDERGSGSNNQGFVPKQPTIFDESGPESYRSLSKCSSGDADGFSPVSGRSSQEIL